MTNTFPSPTFPLRAAVETRDGRWLGDAPDGNCLARVVRERSAALLSLRTPGVAAEVCTGILDLGEDLRRIGADGDGLVWLYGYAPPPGDPLSGTVARLVAGGAAAGLPVLFTTMSPRATADLASLVSVVLVHRLADPATADFLAARIGTKLVPVGWSAREWTATVPSAAGMGQAGVFQPAAAAQPGMAVLPNGLVQPGGVMSPAAVVPMAGASGQAGPVQPGVAMHPGAAMWPAAAAALPAAGLVPAPAVPARTLLSLGPAEFVLTVHSPRYRLVKLARAVPARLPRGAMP